MQKTAIGFRFSLPGQSVAVSSSDQPPGFGKRFSGAITKTLLVVRSNQLRSHRANRKTIFLAMKLTIVLLIAALLNVRAESSAQSITLSGKELPLKGIFSAIKQQTGYVVFTNADFFSAARPVTVAVHNMPLRDFLELILEKQPFTYRIENRTISLVWKDQPVAPLPVPLPAPQPVTGKVVDSLNKPIARASVKLSPGNKGTSTAEDGSFSIPNVSPGNYTLEISSVGYQAVRKKITVTDQEPLLVGTIALKTNPVENKEVVVTGLYSRPRENFTGASSAFTKEALQRVSNTNLLSALKTLDPSFQLPENINLGADPNTLPDVVVRGGNSIIDPNAPASDVFNYTTNKVNTPLFILDGFETNLQRIVDLDMNRVARVDILKDAAATAIYGSRAANGVIVIETIRPQGGKLQFTYTGTATVEVPDLRGYDLLDAREKLQLEVDAGLYNGSGNIDVLQKQELYSHRLALVTKGVNTYWLSQPLQTGVGQKHNLYVEGAGNNAFYGINISYDKRNGVMKGSDRSNLIGSTYLSYRAKNFQIRNDLTLTYNKANNSPYGSFSSYTSLNPYWAPTDSLGNTKLYLEQYRFSLDGTALSLLGAGTAPVNPMYNASLNVIDRNTYQNVTNNLSAVWQVLSGLRINGRFAIQRQVDQQDVFLPARHTSFVNYTADQYNQKGSYTQVLGAMNLLEGSLTADYNRSFGKHVIFATAGTNLLDNNYYTNTFKAVGFPNERLDKISMATAYENNGKPVGTEARSRLFGLLSNLSYAYDNRYLLDLSYRIDGSSQFGSQKRFAPFWALGLGWNLHKDLLRNYTWIDRLKLRYSVGSTGSQTFPSYQGLTTFQYFTSGEYDGNIGSYLLGYGNSNLAWQQTLKHNIGADLTLFSKFNITANYFVEITKGSFASITTAASTGFTMYTDNMGNVENRGWEVNINANLWNRPGGRDFVNVFANAFGVKGKITQVSNSIKELNKKADNTLSKLPLTRYAEGYSTTALWAIQSLGIDPASGRELYRNRDGSTTYTYNPQEQVIVGDTRPDVQGNFGVNAEIKGIGVNIFLNYYYGAQVYNQTLVDRVENANLSYNVDRRVYEDRWRTPGDITFYKGLVDPEGNTITSATYTTSRFVQDDNLLSMTSGSVYYRFSDSFNKRYNLSNSKVTFYVGELFRLSSVKRERGLDYPFSQTFTLMLQTSF